MDDMTKVEQSRGPNPDRERLHDIITDAQFSLQERFGDRVALERWPSIGQECLYTAKAPVTMLLSLNFDEDREQPNAILGVFDGDRITIDVSMSVGPSKSGQQDPALMSRWQQATAGTSVAINGLDIGALPVMSRVRLKEDVPFEGTHEELVELLVARGAALIEFVLAFAAGE